MSSPSRLRSALVLGSLTALGPLSIDMYLPALPQLTVRFEASEAAVQLTLTACLAGLGLGQLLLGPLSDAFGRRRPLVAGLAVYVAASLACALAPSVQILTAARLAQGFAGAAGVVIARAVVRDLYSGPALARFFSMLMLVNGMAPVLAPVIGGQLLRVVPRPGVFVTLAAYGVLVTLGAGLGLPETLPRTVRRPGGLRRTGRVMGRLLSDRRFVGYAAAQGLLFAAMFAYIAGSPFVLQQVYRLTAQQFGLVFGMNALGIMALGQLSGRLAHRVAPRRLLLAGLLVAVTGGAALVATSVAGLPLPAVLPGLFLVVASVGLVMPNATALAMSGHPGQAGSASALLGVMQFALGAAAAPLVGAAGTVTAVPMALLMLSLAVAALLAFALLTRAGKAARSETGGSAAGR